MNDTRARRTAVICQVSDRFLDQLLDRVRESPNSPDTVRQRFPVPAVGVIAAELHFQVDRTRVRLRADDGGAMRIRIGMTGRIRWEFAIGRVEQIVDVTCVVLVKPTVVLVDSSTIELRTDFSKVRIKDTTVTVVETPYLPRGVTQDLLGPLGRRFLDTFAEETMGVFMRSLGKRSASLGAPLAKWITTLGVAPATASTSIHDGVAEFSFSSGPDDATLPATTASLATAPFDDAIRISVANGSVPTLLELWAAQVTAGGSLPFDNTRFTINNATIEVTTEPSIAMPGRLPNFRTRVRMRLDPIVDDGIFYLRPHIVDIDLPTGFGWFDAMIRSWIDRGLARRMRFDVIWQLPLPAAGEDEWWQLALEAIDVGAESIDTRLSAWFPPHHSIESVEK